MFKRHFTTWISLGLLFAGPTFGRADDAPDAYQRYVENAPEFKPVKQDPAFLLGRWDTWIYMPWRYQWTIGTDAAGGEFCRDLGINGGFTDREDAPLGWLDRYQLRFYNDHTAGKGDLHLAGAENKGNFKDFQRDPRAIRRGVNGPRPIDAALQRRLRDVMTANINRVKSSKNRVAYALDDEPSWGAFVTPLPWRLNDDDASYRRWLISYYGKRIPAASYVTPDHVLAQLDNPIGKLDFSPLLDRLSYQDSVWANLIRALVEHSNRLDPSIPCGIVGAQSPNIWGGYDYAKLSKAVQFIEAYDLGSAQEILRSFNPRNARPQVTTHFHQDKLGVENDIWQSWYYFAHGNRGMIGWVDGWFDGRTPRPWLAKYKATLKELGGVQGPKLAGATWLHDGIALYYSHPSIQVSWCLDIEAHGKTWVNRGNDERLGTSHLVRKAWEYLLADAGLQYNFVAYDEVIRHGVPMEYKVLILPACYALSDIESARIKAFCELGGTVVADFACGLFDQHGKGRSSGALDDLFGVKHDGALTKADFFGGKLWVEANQDAGFNYAGFRELFDTTTCPMRGGYAVAERGLGLPKVHKVGRGRAIYLNLSPQRYLQYREEGTASDAHRAAFLSEINPSGRPPRIVVTQAGKRPPRIETTYWSKSGRTYIFIFTNLPVNASSTGGGGVSGPAHAASRLDVELPSKHAVVNERNGAKLGPGTTFTFDFNGVEPVFFSIRDE